MRHDLAGTWPASGDRAVFPTSLACYELLFQTCSWKSTTSWRGRSRCDAAHAPWDSPRKAAGAQTAAPIGRHLTGILSVRFCPPATQRPIMGPSHMTLSSERAPWGRASTPVGVHGSAFPRESRPAAASRLVTPVHARTYTCSRRSLAVYVESASRSAHGSITRVLQTARAMVL